jgi:hypothetical protein
MLVVVMLLLSPVCHRHYFCLSLPLIMGLVAANGARRPLSRPGMALTLLLAINVVTNVLPHIPLLYVLRDKGLAMYGALLLWLVGLAVLWKTSGTRPTADAGRREVPRTAA